MLLARGAAIVVLSGLDCLLAAAPGSAASFVSGDFAYAYDVALGGGSPPGNECISAGGSRCSFSGGPATLNVRPPPYGQSVGASVSSDTGADSVDVSANASLSVNNQPLGGITVNHSINLSFGDSLPGSFHTTADGSISFTSSVIIDTTTILRPEDLANLVVGFSVFDSCRLRDLAPLPGCDDGRIATRVAAYQVTDLDTNLVIASFTEAASGSLSLDLADINGHQLAISFSSEISGSQPAGFGGGAEFLTHFGFGFSAGTRVEVIPPPPVPEPSTAALVGLGLAGVAAASRRRPPVRSRARATGRGPAGSR